MVETTDSAGVFGRVYGRAPLWYFRQSTPLTEAGDGIKELARSLDGSSDLLADLHDLSVVHPEGGTL